MKSYIFTTEEMEKELQILKADKWAGIKIYVNALGDLHMIKTDEKEGGSHENHGVNSLAIRPE